MPLFFRLFSLPSCKCSSCNKGLLFTHSNAPKPISSFGRYFLIPPSEFGIGESRPVRSLGEAIDLSSDSRDKLVFVNSGLTGGDIEEVINQVAEPARQAGTQVEILSDESALRAVCRSSRSGNSPCIVAAVFYSSPEEGDGGQWNYSLRADGALGSNGSKIVVDKDTNDAEIYALPLQHAIDSAISRLDSSSDDGSTAIPDNVQQYPYTSETPEEREDSIRKRYMGFLIDALAVGFFIAMVGTTYQLTGLVAVEREIGMAQLLDCMMPNRARWQPQFVRLVSNHLAFDLIYGPSWIVIGAILTRGVFSRTSTAIVIIFHVLSGLSLSSLSLFGAAFFRKAQLSGITLVISSLLLGIGAQFTVDAGTGTIAVLSLIFPPMNYVFFVVLMARFERQGLPTSLTETAPESPSNLLGIVFWAFLLVQIIVFPILGAWVERSLYGTSSKSRTVSRAEDSTPAVAISSLTKEFKPSWFGRMFGHFFGSRSDSVTAVKSLTMNANRGQIMVMLGANGSGKSTTLDAVAGLSKPSSGTINVNYPPDTGGFGLCPQKNVLWDNLTVREHVSIFNKIKSISKVDSKSQLDDLISACDITHKSKATSKTLSGGQRRKLQLAMMFTGGSSVCAVDEVSSGLDPISRRKIWDILLAERGARSIILTTHFLDEADLLSDQIVIMSKGSLKAEGTVVELKHKLGSGYRVHLHNSPSSRKLPEYPGVEWQEHQDRTTFVARDSAQAATLLSWLERDGFKDYQVSGPTIEDVFLKLAEEVKMESIQDTLSEESAGEYSSDRTFSSGKEGATTTADQAASKLVTGKRIGMLKQAWILFRKRMTILRRNFFPTAAALLIPIVCAALVTLLIQDAELPSCSLADQEFTFDVSSLVSQVDFELVVGPSNRLSPAALERFSRTLPRDGSDDSNGNLAGLQESIHVVDTLTEFNEYIENNFGNVTPGGFFLGDDSSPPTFAWRGDGGDLSFATITQNALDVLLSNTSISSQYRVFDVPDPVGAGDPLQFVTYFGLAMAVFPAFFALYPTVERLRNVRSLHFSNGVRSLPLWLAHLSFDFIVVLVISAVAMIIFQSVEDVWYHVEYLFPVFLLYGLASTVYSYVISLLAKSQLAAFALAGGSQAAMFLLYFIAYMLILTFAPSDKIDSYHSIAHFTIALVSPAANLTRALFLALNVFTLTCRDRELASNPADITVFGGPILYLIVQSLLLFALLLLWDSGFNIGRFSPKRQHRDAEDRSTTEAEISNELTRVASSRDGLRVMHVNKQFKKNLAVDDVTFGVPHGEVFALLGPNGAGKSTIISLIRGDIQPSRRGGDIFVEDVPVAKNRAQARSHLGVCPQFDAIDNMTVREHLEFYARIRGVPDPTNNVNEVMHTIGLQPYSKRLAGKLSGGNQRKLSLGIALMGNPSVLLLDEPSSGMDAASKRVMWRTLASVVPNRSLVLTTHSMEEADALANRAGIMATRMLALGTTDYLRRKHGHAYHVHLVHRDAPHTSDADMEHIRRWVKSQFPSASVEQKTWHGQMRFSVPAGFSSSSSGEPRRSSSSASSHTASAPIEHEKTGSELDSYTSSSDTTSSQTISSLFTALEQSKADLGCQYYSVSQTTLDQVFLNIVGKHDVGGEDDVGRNDDKGTNKKSRLWKAIGR